MSGQEHIQGSAYYVDGPKLPISIHILTLNEEVNMIDCLASCAWSDDVHIIDSGSTDSTQDMARECGVHLHVNPFESFGQQRNWAIDNAQTKYKWIFHLDADERFTPELVKELKRVLDREPQEAGFFLPNKLMFLGRWLKRTGNYPTYQMRLFHVDRCRFVSYGHGQREETTGALGTINVPYLHYSFSKGLTDWIEKHNRYSTLEALQVLGDDGASLRLRDILCNDPVVRRRALKVLSYRIPMRQRLRWFVTMFLLRGVLDGRPGRIYARLMFMYERMIEMKLALMRNRDDASSDLFEQDIAPTVADTKVHDVGDKFAM